MPVDVADVAVERLSAAQFVHSEAPVVQAHTHTDSVFLRYKTCAQLLEPALEPMDTHIKLCVSRCTYACYALHVYTCYVHVMCYMYMHVMYMYMDTHLSIYIYIYI